MTAKNIASWAFACSVIVILASAVGQAQDTLNLQLDPSNVDGWTYRQAGFTNGSGTGQCPGIGTASFSYSYNTKVDPVNDEIYFKGTTVGYGSNNLGVTDITHFRGTTTITAGTGNKVIQRQDWTRIKENPNGIDDTTGIRHYVGLFLEESQQPKGKKPVVTATTEGIMTLQEPLFFNTGPLASVATRVAVAKFIGQHPAWLEPFSVNDARICSFLATGVVQPVNPIYNTVCTVDGNTQYNYNGVQFDGNIVSCP
jgi:hypothetical protein